jgi:hypothetical protein
VRVSSLVSALGMTGSPHAATCCYGSAPSCRKPQRLNTPRHLRNSSEHFKPDPSAAGSERAVGNRIDLAEKRTQEDKEVSV